MNQKEIEKVAEKLRFELFSSPNVGHTMNLLCQTLAEVSEKSNDEILGAFRFLFEPDDCECQNCHMARRLVTMTKKELLKLKNRKEAEVLKENLII